MENNEYGVLHALWTLNGLGAFEGGANLDLVEQSLSSSSYAVQRAAISLLPETTQGSELLAAADLLNKENLQIKLAALLRAGDLPETDGLFKVVDKLAANPSTQEDKWLAAATKIYYKVQDLSEADPATVAMLMPASDTKVIPWTYTEEKPADNWYASDFKATNWKKGKGRFGKPDDETTTTTWNTSDIWLRREFNLTKVIEQPVLKISYDDNFEVYINGELLTAEAGASREYRYFRIAEEKKSLFKKGKNVIAVYCHDKGGNRYIDVGLGEISKLKADVVFNINTVSQKMAYDKTVLKATAGQTVRIRLNNGDEMPHNLVIVKAGSIASFGKVVDAFLKDPNAEKMAYVPNSRYVLAATKMLAPAQSDEIIFTLPDIPGRYPFVCTFPGHWQTMQGVILVTAPGSYLADDPKATQVAIMGGGGSHDFLEYFGKADGKVLFDGGKNSILYTENPSALHEMLPSLDVLMLTNNQPFDPATQRAIISRAREGMAMMIVHPSAWYNWQDWPQYNKEIVGGGSRSHEKLQEFEVEVIKPGHPIMKNVPAKFRIIDELYRYEQDPDGTPIEVLAIGRGLESGKEFPVVWTVIHPNAKIVGNTLGHDARAHNLAAYKSILSNSLKWAKDGAGLQ